MTDADLVELCAVRCRSRCCRVPTLPVTVEEYERLFAGVEVAASGRVAHRVTGELAESPPPDGMRFVPLARLGGCPHLSPQGLCRVYEQRPQACREFPPGPTAGCLVSPAEQQRVGLVVGDGDGWPTLVVGESTVVLSTPMVAGLRAALERWEAEP